MTLDLADIVTLMISVVALSLSVMTYRLRGAKRRHDVLQYLQHQANTINESFVKFEVRSPYEAFLGIPSSETKEARAKMTLLILQLNLLRSAFNSRSSLTEEEFSDYERWGSTILRPWIEADARLREAYGLWIESEDGGKAYTKWLRALIPIVGKNVL